VGVCTISFLKSYN
jgi:hypothetical protein